MNEFMVFIKKHKVAIISTICFWLFAELFLVAPVAVSIVDSSASGAFDLSYFLSHTVENIVGVAGLKNMFGTAYIGTFGVTTVFFTIFLVVCLGIGLFKARKKGSFDKIEHGSSDWCVGGEQYRVLSKNSGLILAENNYLPLDKIGNINTLIVRRFWFW